MNPFKKILGPILFILNIITLVLFILSAFSDRISPDKSIIFPLLGLAFPFITGVNILFLIVWSILNQWKYILLNIIVLVIGGNAIITYFPVHSETKDIPPDCIKILSYNVMQFEHKKANTQDNPNYVLEYILNSKADIVCIQEYGANKKGPHLTDKEIKQTLKTYPYNYTYRFSSSPKNEILGLALFSKFPILSTEKIVFESKYNGSFSAVLDINGKRTTLINNHLESNKLTIEERNDYSNLIDHFDSKKLDRVTGTILNRLIPAFKIRAKQAETIANTIAENENPYIIVCGDFNDTPVSYSRRVIKKNLNDAFADTGFGLGTSFNRHRFYFRIDHILHSKNIKAYNCTVDRSIKNSDHYPIWTYLDFR